MNREAANLEAAFARAWPASEWRDLHVVLAVSGGADSVALLRAAVAVKQRGGGSGRLYAAHMNHGLRGAESEADAAWVAELCRQLDVPLEQNVADIAATAAQQGDGWEAAARSARYDFLRTTAERLGARYVAVAHTADDQIETILHRFCRGTGIAGLAGMPTARPLSPIVSLIRPLLSVRRAEILKYLVDLHQDFREDATNTDCRFTRNRLRHELLPLVRARYNADFDTALLRLAQQAAESQEAIARLASELAERSVAIERPTAAAPAQRVLFDCRTLATEPRVVCRELAKSAWASAGWPLQDMGFDQWQQLAELLTGGETVKVLMFPGSIRAEHRDGKLELRR